MKYYSQDGKYSIEVAIQQDMCKWAEYILVQRGFRNVEPNNALRQYLHLSSFSLLALVKQKWTVKGTDFSNPAILDRTLRNEK